MSTPEFYANARAYDIAFGDRDFVDECNFLEFCLREFGRLEIGDWRLISPNLQSPISHLSFLELAAGPARHAREFARRGWRAIALDLSGDMLEYACEGARDEGVTIEAVAADMTNFVLSQPVALAANLMESLSHLTTNEQVVAHLRAVSRNLLPGGIFVIEMAHPDSIWRESLPNYWTSHHNGTEIDILFGAKDDPYDWITQQWTVTTRLNIREAGLPERVVESHNQHRWYQPQELRALVDLSGGFSQAWWFGNMLCPPPPLTNSDESDRMIVVLRR
jgi:SAM-dependent methyltransferase